MSESVRRALQARDVSNNGLWELSAAGEATPAEDQSKKDSARKMTLQSHSDAQSKLN